MRQVVLPAIMAAILISSPAAWAKDFKSWLKETRVEAKAQGISPQLVDRALPDTMQPIARIVELDRKQPEKTKTFEEYLDAIVNQQRVEKGRTRFLNNRSLLSRVSEAYGVESQVIVALWGIETNYGANTGGYEVVNALATLAYDGRRADFFKDELFKALKIIDQGHIALHDMKGSWAGAMGQSQFMPSSFLNFAQDFNNDGKRDIWNTQADVFASAANYLSKGGWKKGEPWGREIKLPKHIDRTLIGLDAQKRNIQYWHDKGVRAKDGKPLPFEGGYYASIIQPGGAGTRAFLVYDNYRVIMKWNKSNYFATSVGLLSDKILAGAPVSVGADIGMDRPVDNAARPSIAVNP